MEVSMPSDDNRGRDDKNQNNGFIRAFSMLWHIGISVIACIAVGIVIGRLLDVYLKTSPWLLLVFTLLGMGAAFKTILDIAKKM